MYFLTWKIAKDRIGIVCTLINHRNSVLKSEIYWTLTSFGIVLGTEKQLFELKKIFLLLF